MTFEPGQSLLHYRLAEKIGEGGMGVVWRALDTTLDRHVAIKLLPPGVADDPERLARFEREARLLAALNHPNIAAVYGLHEQGGVRFLAMELVAGEDLAARMGRGALSATEALAVASQIAEALVAAHDAGVVHRDLKPANVVLAPDGTVKVLDFGLAKMAAPEPGAEGGDSAASPTITSLGTRAGLILGTAAYMSPEQARGQVVDRRADVWALGVVVYEMLTGACPFRGETVSDTLAAVLRADIDLDALPASTPPGVRRVLGRCLERDPRRRLRDAGELRVAVEEHESGADAAPRAVPPASRRWVLTAAGVVAGLVLGILGARWLAPSSGPAAGAIQAAVPPPPGARYFLASRQPGPAMISPDGTKIAFVARDAERTIRLWVHDLRLGTAAVLEGTDGASYPFWSPDGRHLGFFADRKLKRVPADGGAVLSLCDAAFGKGGSWNAAGDILFAPSYNSEIWRVSADGGEPVRLTAFPEETAENSHRFPWFFPDGKRFLYLSRVSDREDLTAENMVRVASLDGGPETDLVTSPAQAQLSAGHLLYLRERVLMARRFDAASLELEGDPFVVADEIHVISGAARAVFSASSDGTLIYMRSGAEGSQALAWFDRAGERLGGVKQTGSMYDVAVSHDGKLFAANLDDDVWVFDTERGTRRRVTFERKDARSPVWAADDRALIYTAPGRRFQDVWSKAADGSGEARLLLESEGDKLPEDVSPDGRFLVYAAGTPASGFDLWILPLDGSAEAGAFVASGANEEEGRFSPDGRFVAYQTDETGREEIFVTSFPDRQQRVQVSTEGGWAPRWSDDGRELYFVSPRDEVMAAALRPSGDGLEVVRVERLFDLTVPAYGNYDVSHGRFLIETEGEDRDRPALALVLDWPALRR